MNILFANFVQIIIQEKRVVFRKGYTGRKINIYICTLKMKYNSITISFLFIYAQIEHIKISTWTCSLFFSIIRTKMELWGLKATSLDQ